jgi:hypothetical protein
MGEQRREQPNQESKRQTPIREGLPAYLKALLVSGAVTLGGIALYGLEEDKQHVESTTKEAVHKDEKSINTEKKSEILRDVVRMANKDGSEYTFFIYGENMPPAKVVAQVGEGAQQQVWNSFKLAGNKPKKELDIRIRFKAEEGEIVPATSEVTEQTKEHIRAAVHDMVAYFNDLNFLQPELVIDTPTVSAIFNERFSICRLNYWFTTFFNLQSIWIYFI